MAVDERKQIPALPTGGEPPLKMRVDVEHWGIRLLMPVLTFGGLVLGFVLGRVIADLMGNSFPFLCLSLPLAVALSFGLTQFGERIIKPNWGSGRHVEVDAERIVFYDQRSNKAVEPEVHVVWDKPFSVNGWYFAVPTGKSRIPKGWYCVSLRLQQDEQSMILYTFMKPEVAQEEIPDFSYWFTQLLKRKLREELAGKDARQAALQNRLREYEGTRWFTGGEIAPEHFLAVMTLVSQHSQPPAE
jgi:hypothetical protein